METTAYTSDNIITRSYEEYHQVILNYITYRIAHRYEAEDLTQDVFVRLMDYTSNPQLSSSASFLRLNVLSSLN